MIDLNFLYMLIGFSLASWAVVSNDSIQTLGTFLASNQKIKWYWLFIAVASVMIITLSIGWYINNGDMAFGRLSKIPTPGTFTIWHALAPLVLLLLTRYGLPVSTTFLVLSVFATEVVLTQMVIKSMLGYGIAFISAFIIWYIISKFLDEHIPITDEKQRNFWRISQWLSTLFLWSQWLMHDMANIVVYLPRKLTLIELVSALSVLTLFLGIIFFQRGGKIQNIVLSKTGTRFIRSATIIDIVFALLLWFFKSLNGIPMSTTWVFVGLLAGRELAIHHLHRKDSQKRIIFPMLFQDFLKIMAGLAISVALALIVSYTT